MTATAERHNLVKAYEIDLIDDTQPIRGIFDDRHPDVFARYRVTIQFQDKVMGAIPKDPNVIESWLRTRLLGSEEELRIQVLKTLDDVGIEVPENATREDIIDAAKRLAAESKGNTFRRKDGQLCLSDYQFKALLKEATSILYPYGPDNKWGPTRKAPRSAVAEWLFVDEHDIPLGRTEPDGVHMQVGHVTGPKGPRSTLTYYDYCERATVTFTVSSLEDRMQREHWERVLVLGQRLGLGALRSLSHGQFAVLACDRV